MGLTIHYRLSFEGTASAALKAVSDLRAEALDLPLIEVSDVVRFKGDEADYNKSSQDDEFRWLKIQAGEHVDVTPASMKGAGREIRQYVIPTEIIAFSTYPGYGCEEANFGLCRYPKTIIDSESGKRIRTGLKEWSWKSFCKTQYANSPEAGGLPNFLKCHLSVIYLLDKAKDMGLLLEVSDEGDFYEDRNVQALAEEVEEWDIMMAGLLTAISGAVPEGVGLEMAIGNRSDTELLQNKARLESLLTGTDHSREAIKEAVLLLSSLVQKNE